MAPEMAEMEKAGDLLRPGERTPYWFYDTATIINGGGATVAFDYFFFRDGESGKTRQQTNWLLPGQLPAGYEFTIHTIAWRPQMGVTLAGPVVPLNISNWQQIRGGFIKLIVGQLDVIDVLLVDAVAGGGIFGTLGVSSNAAIDVQSVQNGYPAPTEGLKMKPTYKLVSNQNMKVLVRYPTVPNIGGGVDWPMKVYLGGILYRAWQ